MLRQGGASIAEAYADEAGGELFLVNANIPEYKASAHFNHQPRRPRKLLLHRKEVNRLLGRDQARGGHDRAAGDLFQRARPRQGRARPGARQEESRQARRPSATATGSASRARIMRSRESVRLSRRGARRSPAITASNIAVGEPAGIGVEPRAVIAVGEQQCRPATRASRRAQRGSAARRSPLAASTALWAMAPSARIARSRGNAASSAARNGRQAAISARLRLVLRRHAAHRVGDAGADAAAARPRGAAP